MLARLTSRSPYLALDAKRDLLAKGGFDASASSRQLTVDHELHAAVVIGQIPGTSRRDLPRIDENC
jgi:hypothetical protein